MERAIALLPAPMRPLFEKHRAMVVQRVGRSRHLAHRGLSKRSTRTISWISTGRASARIRYRELPRDFTAAVAKFGRERITRERDACRGAPRRCSATCRRAFQNCGRRGAFGQNDMMFFSAWLAHYVSDAHPAVSAVFNYDGQFTRQ